MKARPTARVLLTIRNRSWTTHQALAELVDNSYGELRGRASNVWITWSPKTRVLTVRDDGQGMGDVIDLFTLGQGETSGAGDIGLYGVGGSEALLWLADYVFVTTLRHGRVARGRANWADCIDKGEFPDINNRWREATVATCPTELLEQRHGTLIELHVRPRLQIHPEVIQERLSRLFSVAFRNGRSLTWATLDPHSRPQKLHPWDPGPLQDVFTGTFALWNGNGLAATVTAGRVDGLSIASSKLAVNFVYRQIKETTAGFGRPIQGACGYVDLSPEWLPYLTTTKDDINEDGREFEAVLMERIAEELRPLVEKLAAAKRARIFSNIRISLKRKMQSLFRAPAIPVIDEDEEPEVATPVDPEATKPRRPRVPSRHSPKVAVIDIEEATNESIEGLLCKVELQGHTIKAFINKDHPYIVQALDQEPINQMLLESVLITALSKEIIEEKALVNLGLLSQQDSDALYNKYDGNALDVLLHVVRILTDGVESMGKRVLPVQFPMKAADYIQ